MTGISVVMADDHVHMRAMLRAALEEGGCEVCGEGASAEEAVRLAVEHEPDVVLLDIHMPRQRHRGGEAGPPAAPPDRDRHVDQLA